MLREIVFCEYCATSINNPLLELCQKTLNDIKKDVDIYNWRNQNNTNQTKGQTK